MNQKLLSGFTAALLISTLGAAPSGYADQAKPADQQPGVSTAGSGASGVVAQSTSTPASQSIPENSSVGTQPNQPTNLAARAANPTASSNNFSTEEKVGSPASALDSNPTSLPQIGNSQASSQSSEVVKVGEYQSQAKAQSERAIATVQAHPLKGRSAATLYVRNIPVLTFLGDGLGSAPARSETGTSSTSSNSSGGAEVKIASTQAISTAAGSQSDQNGSTKAVTAPVDSVPTDQAAVNAAPEANASDSRDPVWRATTAAARLNQLYRDNVNASDIKISWKADRKQYVIAANDSEIVTIDDNTVLPDTVRNATDDILQATNRIRRQIGGASPLSSIDGDPNSSGRVSLGGLSLRLTGYASWYGPGFDGSYTANGEVFNQEALTAAHRSLPFGTQVRVTNMDNGESVIVRITDRGPYAHGRVIDLSTRAARIIGLVQSGVAPVSLEVLGTVQASGQ